MTITYTVDPETIAFSEWHDGEEVGSGEGADLDALRGPLDVRP